jgi:hypothetical protein
MGQLSNCNSIKLDLIDFIASQIDVTEMRDKCVVTLPLKTLDDRYPDIYVERKMPDFFLVHDAGKTASELYAQGIHLTDTREDLLSAAAERLGVGFADGTFMVTCTRSELFGAILAVSQCISLGMWEVVGHKPDFGDAPIMTITEHGLRAWNPSHEQKIVKRVQVKGQTAKHHFDFVSFPDDELIHRPIGLRVLRPSENPRGQAERYGFFSYDIRQTYYEQWSRLAIVVKAEKWSDDAKQLIRKHSTKTLEIETGKEDSIETLIPEYMDEIAA